jgi:hypothetical protein
MQEEPITECGSRPSGRSGVSRSNSVDPGRQTTCAPCRIRCRADAGRDHHHRPVIIAIGRGATGQPRIGGLGDHDDPRRHTGAQHAPLFHQAAWLRHGQNRSRTEADTLGEGPHFGLAGQQMARAKDGLQLVEQSGRGGGVSRKMDGEEMGASIVSCVTSHRNRPMPCIFGNESCDFLAFAFGLEERRHGTAQSQGLGRSGAPGRLYRGGAQPVFHPIHRQQVDPRAGGGTGRAPAPPGERGWRPRRRARSRCAMGSRCWACARSAGRDCGVEGAATRHPALGLPRGQRYAFRADLRAVPGAVSRHRDRPARGGQRAVARPPAQRRTGSGRAAAACLGGFRDAGSGA